MCTACRVRRQDMAEAVHRETAAGQVGLEVKEVGLETPEEVVPAVAPAVVVAVPEEAVVPVVAAVPEAVEDQAAVPVEIDKASHGLTRK